MTVFKPKNMLVTGGAGFIGSNFVLQTLLEDPDVRVVTLDSLTYAGSEENLSPLPAPERHVFIHGDIADADLVSRLLRKYDIDAVVHFAAESHVDRSITGPAPFIRTNLLGTFTLLEAASRFWLEEKSWDTSSCRFHHISTDEVFGSLGPESPRFHERTPYDPSSPYSASKAGSDYLVRAYHRTYGLPITMTNCSNNYGPRQHGEKFIPTVIRSCLEGRKIPIYGDGSNRRDWLYVSDHCRAVDLTLRRGDVGECYCVGGGDERANLEVARQICALLDKVQPADYPYESLIEFVTDRPGHDWRYAIDSSKISGTLGWRPLETMESGLRKTVSWYLERMNVELGERKRWAT